MTRVFIDGAEGTTGLKIRERLFGRKDLLVETLGEDLRKDASARKEKLNGCDLAILCLPDQAAREAVQMIENPAVRVIDASTAHRTEAGWAYGFAELSPSHRAAIAAGKRVAVPGCHASGFVALVYPLIAAGLLGADAPLSCFSVTGYSGGGKKMIAQYEAQGRDAALSSPRQYGLSQAHKHLPEMKKIPGLSYPPAFSPIVADYFSGMVVTVPLFPRLMKGNPTRETIEAALRAHYAGQRLVRVTGPDESGFIAGNALSGRDDMLIEADGNDERVLLVARFDNLGKGASGAAIQCLNLMTGADEAEGLLIN